MLLTFSNFAGAVYTVSSVHKHSLISQSNLEFFKKVVGCWQNVSSDGEALIVGSSSFHALAAAAGKAWSQRFARQVDEMSATDVQCNANTTRQSRISDLAQCYLWWVTLSIHHISVIYA